jgi:hypothetical protein
MARRKKFSDEYKREAVRRAIHRAAGKVREESLARNALYRNMFERPANGPRSKTAKKIDDHRGFWRGGRDSNPQLPA